MPTLKSYQHIIITRLLLLFWQSYEKDPKMKKKTFTCKQTQDLQCMNLELFIFLNFYIPYIAF